MYVTGGDAGVFPAHAGMIPRVGYAQCLKRGVPRTRGDDPGRVRGIHIDGRCSPHTRG